MNPDDFDFAEWLQEFGHGEINRQLGQVTREVLRACRETGGKGTIQLTIKIDAGDHLAELKASVKVQKPMPILPSGSYYVTETGALVTEDPRQLELSSKVLGVAPLRKRDKGDAS